MPDDGAIGRQAIAAAWAINQIGSRDWFNLCQRFIEQSYGTGGQFRSAAAAGNVLGINKDMAQADVGDLVFFRPDPSNGNAGHAAIYVGNGEMVGATNGGITRDKIFENPYWSKLFVGFGDPPEQWRGRASTPELMQGAATLAGNAKSVAGNVAGAAKVWSTAAWGAAAPYVTQLTAAAARHQVPVNVLAGLLIQESGGNPRAVSGAGAQGLMQFMPGTAQGFGIDPFNPDQAIDAGARYLKQLANQSGGDWRTAVGKYNAGPAGNLNNTETRNHITKVMGFADGIGNSLASMGGAAGGGMPGAPGGPPGGGGGDDDMGDDRGRGRGLETVAGETAREAFGGLSELLKEISRISQSLTPAGRVNEISRQRGSGSVDSRVAAAAAAAQGPGQAPGTIAGSTGDTDRGIGPTAPGMPGVGGPPPPASTSPVKTAGAKPPGWTDPAKFRSEGARGTVEIANGFLEDLQEAQDELAAIPANTQDVFQIQRRSQLNARISILEQRIVALRPMLDKAIQDEQNQAQGQIVGGANAAYMTKIPVIRWKPDGTPELTYIDNPGALPNPDMQRQTAADTAAEARLIRELQSRGEISAAEAAARMRELTVREAGENTRLGIREEGENVRLGIREAGETARSIDSNTTQRVTTALSAAVQQESSRIAAQIRAGELTFQQAQEKYKQWYQQNVEAPLAILDRQQRAAEYGLNQQRAVTERAGQMAEHDRGIANIGQQMFGTASTAYNNTLDRTVGAGWQQAQNAALRGEQVDYPTLQVPESMDAFATRKVAELLQGISPYADNILAAGQQLGGNATPMTGQGMADLTNTAIGGMQNAMNNPYQMPEIPPFVMPPPVDVAGLAGAGMANGQSLTGQVDRYLPQPTP